MSKSAGHKHHAQTRGQTIREWANEKYDRNYVTRRELKQFLTIYDKAAARIRGEENEKLEGTLLMALDALTKWKRLPWWVRLFTVPATPDVVRPDASLSQNEVGPEAGLKPTDAEQTLAEAAGEQDMGPEDGAEEGGFATPEDLPVVEQPAAMSRELPWLCRDCGATGRHLVAQSDLNPYPPTCPNCGGAHTGFTLSEDDGA